MLPPATPPSAAAAANDPRLAAEEEEGSAGGGETALECGGGVLSLESTGMGLFSTIGIVRQIE